MIAGKINSSGQVRSGSGAFELRGTDMKDVNFSILAQVSDCHLRADPKARLRGIDLEGAFRSVIDLIAGAAPIPDRLLLSGDLSDDGSPGSYERILSVVAPLGIPFNWLPGNHDRFEVMRKVLPACERYFTVGNWQFVLLDSTIAGEGAGFLPPRQLSYLHDVIVDDGSMHTAIALHHHPITVNSPWIDSELGLRNSDQFVAAIRVIRSCKVVLFGHVHQEVDRMEGNIRYLGAPATSEQFVPDSLSHIPDPRPPGFRLLALGDDGAVTTRIVRVADPRGMMKPDGH